MARSQIRHPRWWCLAVALSTLAALLSARGLTLRTGLGELLPDDQRSVIVAQAVNERLPAQSTLAVVLEGPDPAALRAYVDAAALRLAAIGPPLVGRVDAGAGDTADFQRRFGALYLSHEELRDLHASWKERYDYEVTRHLGLLVVDEHRPPLSEALRDDLETAPPAAYYLDDQRGVAVILVRTPIAPGDVEPTDALVAAVEAALPPAGDLTVGLGGNLLTAAETYRRIAGDLSHVGLRGLLAILGVVALYFRRLRPLVALALTITVGASWTFAWARLSVGHLNGSTGFLFSIVVGNGINFGLVGMAAYLRARKRNPPPDAIAEARRATLRPTLIAAASASVAYGALATTGFPGFQQFGLIAGVGMLLCWLATAAVLPPVLVLLDHGRLHLAFRDRFQAPALPPRLVLGGALVLSLGSGALAYRYLTQGPIEHDLRRIDNDAAKGPSPIQRRSRLADEVAGRQQQDGIAIAVDRVEQVGPLRAILEARRDAARDKPFERVVTIHDLMPERQADKLALIADARDLLDGARRHGWIDPATYRDLAARLPAAPVTIERLPTRLAQPFTERDGTRGRLVHLVPTEGRSVWDARYLKTWADAFRRTELPDGSVVEGSGRSVIFADVVAAVGRDMPRALGFAAACTLLLLGLTLGRQRWLAIAAVALGALWTLGALALLGDPLGTPLRLNFLNFVALPITLGVGADYAVNVLGRRDPMPGVVVLCSLTTTLGYGVLTTSINRAIQSFGRAAATGELLCLAIAVLVIPAWLRRPPSSRRSAGPG